MQGTPAGLPPGMPGIGEEMDGAMQQAPQWLRQFMPLLPLRRAVGRLSARPIPMRADHLPLFGFWGTAWP